MRENITSLTNRRVKQVVRLRSRRTREQQGSTIIEGAREITAALDANLALTEVFICAEMVSDRKVLLARLEALPCPAFEVSAAAYAKMSYGDRRDGILAVATVRARRLVDLELPPFPLIMVIEGVEKPGNIGAILRTCDAAGVHALVVCDPGTDLFSPNVIRASLGTVFTVPTALTSSEEAVRYLRSHKVRIIAAMPEATQRYTEADFHWSAAIAVGSEDRGLSSIWSSEADVCVRIPMQGRADSLNVSVSAALIAYEAVRQRGGGSHIQR